MVRFGVVYVAVVPPLPPETVAHPLVPLADCCHCIVPVYPLTVMVVLLPEQIVAAVAVAVPPTETGLTLMVTFCVKEAEQFGVALVTVMPVICNICPLLAAVSAAEVKLAAPELLATTPVTAVWATPLIV